MQASLKSCPPILFSLPWLCGHKTKCKRASTFFLGGGGGQMKFPECLVILIGQIDFFSQVIFFLPQIP